MFTVKQASTALGVSNTTLRTRGAEFADYLSASANPGKGIARQYTEEDIATLHTVGVLKSELATDAEIRQALDQGQRFEPVDMPQDASSKERPAGAANEAFTNALVIYEAQVSQLTQQNRELTKELLAATERAVRAETKLEAVSIFQDVETPEGGSSGQQGASWRTRLAKWIAGNG